MPTSRNQRQRSTLSTYAPLLITFTVATAGALAWIWSERRGSDEDDERYSQRPDRPSSAVTGPPPYRENESLLSRAGATGTSVLASTRGLVGAAGGYLGLSGSGVPPGEAGGQSESRRGESSRTAERRGVGGRAGPSAREDGFSDHERWTEEAVLLKEKERDKQDPGQSSSATSRLGPTQDGTKKRSVAVVLAAEERHMHDHPSGDEHASLLSHIPPTATANATVYILLLLPPSTQTPPDSSPILLHARNLVSDPTRILPFSTPTGYVHILRHLAPNLVYLQDNPGLSGPGGANVAQLKGWVGQTILVVGDDGTGGLADTETEGEDGSEEWRQGKWYETSEMVGLGKGLEVVDVVRLKDDWVKRTA